MAVLSGSLKKLTAFMDVITPVMNKIVIFLFILFIGFLIGKTLSRLTKLAFNKLSNSRLSADRSLQRATIATVAGISYLVTLVVAFAAVGITTVVIGVVVVTLVLLLSFMLVAALRYTAPNLVASLALHRRKLAGSTLKIGGLQGIVTSVSLLDTTLRTSGGETVIVPNAQLRKELHVIKRKEVS